MSGRDPYGSEVDNLPRRSAKASYDSGSSSDSFGEESFNPEPTDKLIEEPNETPATNDEFQPESPAVDSF